jgi:hypothetical protein
MSMRRPTRGRRLAKPRKASGAATGDTSDGRPKEAKSTPEAWIARERSRGRSSAVDVTTAEGKLVDRGSVSRYRRNHIIFAHGDPADAVFYIQNGEVRLTVVSPRSKSLLVPRKVFWGALQGVLLTGRLAKVFNAAVSARWLKTWIQIPQALAPRSFEAHPERLGRDLALTERNRGSRVRGIN